MTEKESREWFKNCREFEQLNNMGNYCEEMYQAFRARLIAEQQVTPEEYATWYGKMVRK